MLRNSLSQSDTIHVTEAAESVWQADTDKNGVPRCINEALLTERLLQWLLRGQHCLNMYRQQFD